ncbi:PaaI family thioesterase [Jatrophihabitans sp. GAS493]|uniref:PaaI family thioesterase n=1 Tax=Jatrophihabitans sp. GAS493 TaxID=1907575 RepID=UPI0012FE2C75|nr:PaaI family thioesterase [Jatrophihabitans sp. GAS493]
MTERVRSEMKQTEVADPSKPFPFGDYWRAWCEQALERSAPAWPDLVGDLRRLQHAVASTAPPSAVVETVREHISQALDALGAHAVANDDQLWGKLLNVPGRGQTLSPPLRLISWSRTEILFETVFGPFHSGNNSAAHGGAVALAFDDGFGMLADLDDTTRSRTASLTIDFRSITPINQPVRLHLHADEIDGRKRWLRGELRDGERLCAEATALYLALRPDQQ